MEQPGYLHSSPDVQTAQSISSQHISMIHHVRAACRPRTAGLKGRSRAIGDNLIALKAKVTTVAEGYIYKYRIIRHTMATMAIYNPIYMTRL